MKNQYRKTLRALIIASVCIILVFGTAASVLTASKRTESVLFGKQYAFCCVVNTDEKLTVYTDNNNYGIAGETLRDVYQHIKYLLPGLINSVAVLFNTISSDILN